MIKKIQTPYLIQLCGATEEADLNFRFKITEQKTFRRYSSFVITLKLVHICNAFGSPASGGGLKGNPVTIRSYPRSCKEPPNPFSPSPLQKRGRKKEGLKRSFNLRHCLLKREGIEINSEPEDLPKANNNQRAFGWKAGDDASLTPPKEGNKGHIISFSFFLEAHFSNKNFLKDEQETFSDNCIGGRID